MIARHAKIRALRTIERLGEPDHHSAHVTADGLDGWITLTAADYAWAKGGVAKGLPLVLTIAVEEPAS